MMPAGNLTRMVAANTLRSRRHFVLSAFGIVIGIATFVVFLASTEQVGDRKSTRLNSSHQPQYRMPSSA